MVFEIALKMFRLSSAVRARYCTRTSVLEVPSPKGIPVFGTSLSLIVKSRGGQKLHEYVDARHKQLGPIFKERVGAVTSVFLCDAEHIRKVFSNEGKYPKHVLPDCWLLYNEIKNYKRGLYFMDNEEWFEYRRILNRILLKEDFFTKMSIEKENFLQNYFESWLGDSRNGQFIDLEKRLYELSIIFMVSYLIGSPFTKQIDSLMPDIRRLAVVVSQIFCTSVKLSVWPARLAKMCSLKSWSNFENAVDESISISSNLVDAVLRCEGTDGILLDMLEQRISMDVVRCIVVDFIIAAGDTTATAIQWALYLLGRDQHIQHQLFDELKNNERIEDVNLLRNSLKESMRLYPVAPFITRYLPQELQISSYKIDAGQLISVSMYTCGRNEKYFPEANSFKPDRWERNSKTGKYVGVIDPNASLPYALGSRSCIGQKMAHAQILTTLATMIKMYELRVTNTVEIKLNLISVPSEPIELHLRRR